MSATKKGAAADLKALEEIQEYAKLADSAIDDAALAILGSPGAERDRVWEALRSLGRASGHLGTVWSAAEDVLAEMEAADAAE